jgi:PAS domain-containing protein
MSIHAVPKLFHIYICSSFKEKFENRALRRIFGLKSEEVIGDWRKLHNEELHNVYSSPSIIRMIKSRRMRWTGHVTRMEEKRNAYRTLVRYPKGKRPLGRQRREWTVLKWILER